jgi:photosystem II stability/assembly factor-like uncharacterized protein
MKLFYALVFLLTITTLSHAQSGWVKQYGGTTENLNVVYFIDTNNGFVLGNNGTLLHTVDGGVNWVKQQSGTTNNLTSISFVDSKNGFIVGSDTTFLKTSDGGITWLNLSDSISTKFASVSFIDSFKGIAIEEVSYDSARVFKTTNGGFNWNVNSKINNKYLFPRYIKYLTDEEIIVAGENTGSTDVYKSSDGGLTWEFKFTGGGSSSGWGYNKTQFINATMGYLLANHGMTSQYYADFYKTTNGGTSWTQLINSYLPMCQTFFMVDGNLGYAVGNGQGYLGDPDPNTIYKTVNGGKDWVKQLTGAATKKINDVFFTDSNNGILVGDGGLILRTTTGGIKEELSNWKIQPSGGTVNFKRVFLLNDNTGYCLGGYELLKTLDSGINWSHTGTYYSAYYDDYDIWFADPLNGIISACYNIYITTDGGISWQETKTSDHLFGAFCSDNLHRIVVGWGGTIKYTSDGGKVWNTAYSGTASHLKDVYFVNNELGFIVGNEGTILRSENGGLSWKNLVSNTSNSLNGVFFINNEIGIAIGTFGTILRTSDDGETWELQNSGTYSDLNSVFFKDKNNGLIVGELGVILRTTDGGLNWKAEQSGINNSLYGLAIKDSVELTVGNEGTILRNIVDFLPTDTNKTLPSVYNLEQNYPNPFNPNTIIKYSIPKQYHVTIKVYDLLGREITTLVNEEKSPGNYEVKFYGSSVTSGVYFYQIKTSNFVSTKKMVLLK